MLKRFQVGRRFRIARKWSNKILCEVAPLFTGDVINVSGWQDEDKENGYYRNYFTNALSYKITNFGGYRGNNSKNDISLDLEEDLPTELLGCADVIYNHTTLEHVFDVFKAVSNLCKMSRDVVIIVVPAAQEEHSSESFGDYWRFMSGGVSKLFESNGFTPILLGSSPNRGCAIYHLCIASRNPEKWTGKIPNDIALINDGANLFSENFIERIIYRLFFDRNK